MLARKLYLPTPPPPHHSPPCLHALPPVTRGREGCVCVWGGVDGDHLSVAGRSMEPEGRWEGGVKGTSVARLNMRPAVSRA